MFICSLNELKKILVEPADFVRINFCMNFRNNVFELWTAELSETEKKLTKFGENIDEWSKWLLFKLKKPFTITVDVIIAWKSYKQLIVVNHENLFRKSFGQPKMQPDAQWGWN